MVSDELIPAETVTVWIDPLDATKEYTEGLKQYVTTMVGIAIDGKGFFLREKFRYSTFEKNWKSEAVAGVIHFPFTGETHWGWVEHGNNLLDRNEQSKFNSFIISRSHTGNCLFCDFWSQRECKGQFSYSGTSEKVLKEAMGEKVHITKAGGAGYKIVELFNGGAESYFHDNKIKKWDICAGEAILRSTCYGKFTDMSGQRIDYR